MTPFAQNLIMVKGSVVDSITKTPVDAALLLQDAETLKTIKTGLTDLKGSFTLTAIPAGNYKLSIGAMGYKTRIVPINKIDSGILDLGTVLLAATSTRLKQVEIVATKPLIETTDDKIIYNAENDAAAKGSNAIDLLRKTPFVTVDGNDNIQLNGQSNFKVLLNGKETSLFALNLKDALKGFPGALVRKIEIITSPSAKYDAEGIGGIINIITDKKIAGSNGSVSSYYSTLTNYQGSANFNVRTGKIGITSMLSSSGSFSPIQSSTQSNTRTFNGMPYAQRILTGDRAGKNLGTFGTLEISYDIDSVNTLSAYASLGTSSRNSTLNQSINTIVTSDANSGGSLNLITDGGTDTDGFGLDYIKKGKKNKEEEFTVRFNGQLSKSKTITTSFQTGALASLDLMNDNREKNAEYTFQTDYSKPISALQKLETGIKVIARKAVSDYESLFRTNTADPYLPNPANTNNFRYRQHVYSAYASYNFKLGSYALRAGIRTEYTAVEGNFITTSKPITQSYTNFIPNLQATYKWNDKLSSVLSYTIRLQRPSITNLNPFIYNTDPLNITFGNPNLGAQTFHNVNLQTRFIKGNTFAGLTLYGSLSNNMISQYALFDPSTGVTSTTSGNIGKEKQISVIMSFSTKINKLNFGLNSIVRYNSVQTNSGLPVLQEGFSGNLFFNGNYKLNNWFNLSGSGGFLKQSYSVLGRGGSFIPYQVNVGYTLIKDKLSGTVNFNNFFKKDFNNKTYVQTDAFEQVNSNVSPYRVTYFGLTYKFGRLKENVSRKKGVSNDDLL
ncbi:outer membrane beta-barrel family protein [Pedobacter polaris]|nr:outer membrane beta-barrel family protein [Pedobacter polaris]